MPSRDLSRRTKIVATIGPATSKADVLRAIIEAGATTLRLNFSHGDHEDHRRNISLIRQIAFELNQPVGILQDLQGPKIRLGKYETGSITLKNGDPYIITSRKVPCTQEVGYVSYSKLAQEVPEGASILLDDGKVEMVVEKVDAQSQNLHCRVVVGGKLSNNKGVNFPGVYLSIKALTEKDREDLIFGLDQGVDWVALSFVRNPEDVLEIKDLIANAGKKVPVIVKIEKHEAIEQMEKILTLADGVMVARGDLGVELPAEDVPILQKRLIATANRLGIPVITATQMLDSMAGNPRPTRAEVSDVANAIMDGTDAVMLSNETAVGDYPVQAVATMATIAKRIEKEPNSIQRNPSDKPSIANAISAAVSHIAQKLDATAILSLTKSGATARNVSKFRPATPIFAITPHVDVARRLQLVWGARPLLVPESDSTSKTFKAAMNIALENNFLQAGDLVVTTAGTLPGVAGSTDLIKVEMVQALLTKGKGMGQGKVSGRARIVTDSKDITDFGDGEILVVKTTDVSYVDMIRRAKGIVIEDENQGCHGAKLGMYLDIPVIIGCKDATQQIREGSIISINARRGTVYSGIQGDLSGTGE